MPNELNIALATTGLTVTAQPYQNGAAIGSAISCPETGSTGFYSGNMAGSAGTYQIAFLAAGANVGSGSIVWDGTAEVASSTLTQANVQSALTAQGLTTARADALDNLDAAVSSRLAPSGTLATVTNLTNAPASVTPSDIWNYNARTLTSASGPTATEIRQEMDSNSTKLSAIKDKTDNLPADPADQSLLDAAIAGVAAPTAGQVASQVRTELSAELAKVAALNTERLANVATTAIVGNLIAQANS